MHAYVEYSELELDSPLLGLFGRGPNLVATVRPSCTVRSTRVALNYVINYFFTAIFLLNLIPLY